MSGYQIDRSKCKFFENGDLLLTEESSDTNR